MNKLMIVAAAASLATGVFGATATATPNKPVPPTLEQVKANVAEVKAVAATNTVFAQRMLENAIGPLRNSRLFPASDVLAYCLELDTELDAMGFSGQASWYTDASDRFPKIDQRAFVTTGIETNTPYVVSLGRKYERMSAPRAYSDRNATLDELVGLLNENIALVNGRCRMQYSYGTIEHFRKFIQSAGVRPVKKYLRKQGKSFVTKNGVNPCEGLMTELNTALNAPYFEGLNAWFTKVGVNASIDTSKIPVAAEVQKLKASILDADKDLNVNDEFILKIGLGVEGYNAFVKEYNGEN